MQSNNEVFRSIIEDFIPFNKQLGFKLPEARKNFISQPVACNQVA